MPNPNVLQRAISALGRGLLSGRPDLSLSLSGAVTEWRENVLPGTDTRWFQAELEQGDGRELQGKFRAAHSSSALAVNSFARFKSAVDQLSVGGWSGFDSMRFEAKCSAGILGRRSPNLDVLLVSPTKVVGIESKCTEHLTPHTSNFSPAYNEQITDWRRETAWFRLMEALIDEPRRYRYLDAAQLVKHAFGLGHTFDGQDVTLLYLYWEPRNADAFPALLDHRQEVARFAAEVKGARPSFRAIAYPELWDSWAQRGSPAWLPEHVSALRSRYDIAI